MTLIFFLQLVLPLLFIGGIGFAPPKSTLAFFTQTVGTSAALLALALTGLWLFSALVDAVCIRWFVGGRSFPWLAATLPVRRSSAFRLDALDILGCVHGCRKLGRVPVSKRTAGNKYVRHRTDEALNDAVY